MIGKFQFMSFETYSFEILVGCRGVVELVGANPRFAGGGLAKIGACVVYFNRFSTFFDNFKTFSVISRLKSTKNV